MKDMVPQNDVKQCAMGFEVRLIWFGGCVKGVTQSVATLLLL